MYFSWEVSSERITWADSRVTCSRRFSASAASRSASALLIISDFALREAATNWSCVIAPARSSFPSRSTSRLYRSWSVSSDWITPCASRAIAFWSASALRAASPVPRYCSFSRLSSFWARSRVTPRIVWKTWTTRADSCFHFSIGERLLRIIRCASRSSERACAAVSL